MSYNLFCETKTKVQWENLNRRVQSFTSIEYVPIPGINANDVDALGLSVPLKNVGDRAWREIQVVINILKNEFDFIVYDLYYGKIVDSEHMDKIKEAVI